MHLVQIPLMAVTAAVMHIRNLKTYCAVVRINLPTTSEAQQRRPQEGERRRPQPTLAETDVRNVSAKSNDSLH